MGANDFIASGITIGGVYAFKAQSQKDYSFNFSDNRLRFEYEYYSSKSDVYDVIGNKKLVFGEKRGLNIPEQSLRLKGSVGIALSDGTYLNGLALNCHISIYLQGFSSVLFWIDISENDLNYNQIVEIVGKARRASGNAVTNKLITISQGIKLYKYSDFHQMLGVIEKDICIGVGAREADQNQETYIYPITYIHEVKGCKNSKQIVENYSKQIVGLCDTWKYYNKFFKQTEIARILATDLHPFEYGVSVYTSSGMVELHSENFKELKKHTGYTTTQQHIYEQVFLYIICEVAILHLYVLKWYDDQLTMIGMKSFRLRWNFIGFIKHLNRITNLHNVTIRTLSLFKNTYFVSKSYIPYTIDKINEVFRIDKFSESVKDKLNDIKQQLTIAYSMTTTVFVIILTVIGLIFTIYQVLQGSKTG
jgi:hypothetical protein